MWTPQPRLPESCPTSPERHRRPCPHPDLGCREQVLCCADREDAAAATWLYLHTSHIIHHKFSKKHQLLTCATKKKNIQHSKLILVDTFWWRSQSLQYFAGYRTHCRRSLTSVFVNGWKLVGMGQQTVPLSTCILIQTTLSPVKSGVQRTLPQGASVCPIHCYEKHTRRRQTWEKTNKTQI